jgi:outer membrane protein
MATIDFCLSKGNNKMRLQSLRWLGIAAFAAMLSAPVMADEVKVRVVNVAKLLDQAPQAKDASAALEREFAPQQRELNKLNDEIEKLAKDYEKNKSVMSEAQRETKERDIVMKKRDLQRRRNDVQELLNIRRNEELSKLQDLVNVAIKTVGEKEGYDLVLYDGIAYTRETIDITSTVLNYLAGEGDKRKNLNKP